IHVANNLGHCMAHICSTMKTQLQERDALDILAFNVLNSGDVEEVILEIVGEVTFHLLRVHAAVGLCNVNRGRAEVWKNVHWHASQGKECTERHSYHSHHDGNRSRQGCKYQLHIAPTSR